MLAPHLEQLVAGALQQTAIQLELRGEVVVEHGSGHTRPRGDLVDRRAAVAVLREHLRGRPFDDLAACVRGKSSAPGVAGLSRAGKLTRPGLPKPTAILEAAVLSHHYREMVTLLFPSPPPSVQRLLFPLIARIAQRRGHRAGEFAALA